LILFVLAYGVVFSFGIYYINRLITLGLESPASREPGQFSHAPITGARGAETPH
jgi:cytochrome d ubiquinol oxidase subunit I